MNRSSPPGIYRDSECRRGPDRPSRDPPSDPPQRSTPGSAPFLFSRTPIPAAQRLRDAFDDICDRAGNERLRKSAFADAIEFAQEAAINHSWIYLALRTRIAGWTYVQIHLETMDIKAVSTADFLRFKERLAMGRTDDEWLLEVDFAPFSRGFYRLQEADPIGRGVEFLNRRLSSRLFDELGTAFQQEPATGRRSLHLETLRGADDDTGKDLWILEVCHQLGTSGNAPLSGNVLRTSIQTARSSHREPVRIPPQPRRCDFSIGRPLIPIPIVNFRHKVHRHLPISGQGEYSR